MGSYSIRDQGLIQRIERAEKDLLMYKQAQLFGRDVTTPRLVERRNSDGTPTDHDIEGVFSSDFGWDEYSFGGQVFFKAKTQSEPYASPFLVAWINSSKSPISQFGGVSAYLVAKRLNDPSGAISYDIFGADADIYDPSVDRLYVKVYMFATDDGEIEIDLTQSSDGYPGSGTVVPLT